MSDTPEHNLGVGDLLALRPTGAGAVVQTLAATAIQERILHAVIQAGPEGMPTKELAEQLDEPFRHVQRVTNVMRYENKLPNPLIKRMTGQMVMLDQAEYDRMLENVNQREALARVSLQNLGDTALSTVLKLATLTDKSPINIARNRETVTLLLAHANLPLYFRHFIARYRTLGIMAGGQTDNNFYRRIGYMQRLPLFAEIITYNSGHNHSTYTIWSDNLDSARTSGLIVPPVTHKPESIQKPPRVPKPIAQKPAPKPTPQPKSKPRALKPVPKPVKEPAATAPSETEPVKLPSVMTMYLEKREAASANKLLGRIRGQTAKVRPTPAQQALLDKINTQYRKSTGGSLFLQREDGTVHISFAARRVREIIFLPNT